MSQPEPQTKPQFVFFVGGQAKAQRPLLPQAQTANREPVRQGHDSHLPEVVPSHSQPQARKMGSSMSHEPTNQAPSQVCFVGRTSQAPTTPAAATRPNCES